MQNRRTLLKNLALGTSAVIASPAISFAKDPDDKKKYKLKGIVNLQLYIIYYYI